MKYLWDNKNTIWDEWFFKDVSTRSEAKSNPMIMAFIGTNDIKGLCHYYYNYRDESEWNIPIHYTNMANFKSEGKLNQLEWALDTIRNTPSRKSIVVNYWDPQTTYQMADISGNKSVVLPACHMGHQVVINDDKLSLLVQIRSNDMFLGNPFNVAQYGLLAHMYSKLSGYPAHELVVMIGDSHIYSNQLEQVQTQIGRKDNLYDFPRIKFNDEKTYTSFSDFQWGDFSLEGYKYHDSIKADVVVVGGY
jgi:thymidylate synthase